MPPSHHNASYVMVVNELQAAENQKPQLHHHIM
jgi:hypothetical protein